MEDRSGTTFDVHRLAASVACAAVLLGTFGAHRAFAADQMFPTAASQHVSVEYKQDGRTVRGAISNASRLVATRVEVSCFHSAPQRSDCAQKKDGGRFSELRFGSLIVEPDEFRVPRRRANAGPEAFYMPSDECRYVSLGTELTVTYEVTLLPGKSASLYAELPAGRVLDSCSVREVRGREKRWFEY